MGIILVYRYRIAAISAAIMLLFKPALLVSPADVSSMPIHSATATLMLKTHKGQKLALIFGVKNLNRFSTLFSF